MAIKKIYSIEPNILKDDGFKKNLWGRFGSSSGYFISLDESVLGEINKMSPISKEFITHLMAERAIILQSHGSNIININTELISFLQKWKTSSGFFPMTRDCYGDLIENFLINAIELIIVDPYFFSATSPRARERLIERNELFIMAIKKKALRLNRIIIHYRRDDKGYYRESHSNFKTAISELPDNIKFETYQYEYLHNRYLIDQDMVVLFGNSFQLMPEREDYFQVFSKPNLIRGKYTDTRQFVPNGGVLTSGLFL